MTLSNSPKRRRLATHIVNISGGKDSATCALLAAERGWPFRLVMADTGNESPITIEYAHYVADFVGQPLEIVRYDFTAKIAAKARFVAEKWPDAGVPQSRIDRALEILKPTGNAFLDLCIWKGRFPSRRAQFCTEFLKAEAVKQAVADPALQTGPIIQWLGVRRDESPNRKDAPMFQKVRMPDHPHDMLLFRPIIHWTAQNVFSFAAAKGLKPNPLYLEGMGRVGCFPCINAAKPELREIARRHPEAFEKISEWEAIVASAAKLGSATFFAADVTPEGAALGRWIQIEANRILRRDHPDLEGRKKDLMEKKIRSGLSATADWPDAMAVKAWSGTVRGGRQWDMLDHAFADDEGPSCSSQYGLCE